jgi:hypothetical protein
MNNTPKGFIALGIFIGSIVGGEIPSLFGADWLSMWGLIGSTIGALLGLWAAYKLSLIWF